MIVDTFIETKVALIEYAFSKVLEKVALYLKRFSFEYDYLLDFIQSPQGYLGDLGKTTGMRKIIEVCIYKTLSTLWNELKEAKLSILFTYKSILKRIYGG